MKFERFIATFVMMNIVLMIAVVFSGKNEIFVETAAQIIYGEKVQPSFFALSPDELAGKGYQNGSGGLFASVMDSVFSETPLSKNEFDKLDSLPPYEKAVGIVKMFSLMGDGECLSSLKLTEKINKTAEKAGCSEDFAQIFAVLGKYAGLQVRIVSSGFHFADEIFDGEKWIYIDPYFAMSASSQEGYMSYIQFADAMVNNGWIRFNYFGGEDHCMNGKPVSEHPYFGDQYAFASVYGYNGDNVPEIIMTEHELSDKPLFIRGTEKYKRGAPALIYTEITASRDGILRKYVTGGLVVIAAVFAGTNIVLPLYFITGLITGIRRKN